MAYRGRLRRTSSAVMHDKIKSGSSHHGLISDGRAGHIKRKHEHKKLFGIF